MLDLESWLSSTLRGKLCGVGAVYKEHAVRVA